MQSSHYSISRFLIMWSGQLLSSIGSGLTAFALGIYIYQLTHSATMYSFILLAAFLPSLLLKPIGGVLSDRINRRILMIIGDLGSAIGLMFILAMMIVGINNLWVIYVGCIISSIFVAFQNPAYKASVTDLVPPEFYTKSSGLMQLAESSKYLISPIIAGFLVKIVDIKIILIVDIMTFIIAIITVFSIHSKNKTQNTIRETHFMNDLYAGFRYLYKNQAVFLLLSVISIVTFFIGLFQALLGPMILSFSTAQTFGIISTISTSGMLIGSSFLGLFGQSSHKMSVLTTSLLLCGIFFSCIGITTSIILITFFGFLFFLVLPFVNTSLDVIIRKNVENTMQGRIWSIVSLISQLGMAIAFGIGGYLADNIFNPLLLRNGSLASSIGLLIGTGPGRGIGLIFILSGIFVSTTALIIGQLNTLKTLDCTERGVSSC